MYPLLYSNHIFCFNIYVFSLLASLIPSVTYMEYASSVIRLPPRKIHKSFHKMLCNINYLLFAFANIWVLLLCLSKFQNFFVKYIVSYFWEVYYNIFDGCTIKTAYQDSFFRSSPRSISTHKLNMLPHLHFEPINHVVFVGSYSIWMGNLILRLASCLDAFSTYPFRT